MAPKKKLLTPTGAELAVTKNGVTKNKKKFHLENITLPELTTEGVLMVTGTGDLGQLGLGRDILEKNRPALVNVGSEIVDIYAGGMHTVCLTKSGNVLTFGCNDEGALGRLTKKEDDIFTPGKVELKGKVIQITAGDSHSAALLDNGQVFAWGTFRDSHGTIRLSLHDNKHLPYEILTLKGKKIIKIASGADHMVFLIDNGEIWTCGSAEQGQIGRTTKRGSDREKTRHGGGEGNIDKFLNPAPISLKANLRLHFENIWASTYCTFAKVAGKDDIYVFGLNNYHQIGLKETEPHFFPKKSVEFSKYKWQHISGGQHHTLGLTTDGKVFVIGRKEYGRLGLGENCKDATVLMKLKKLSEKKIVNVACGSSTSFAVSEEGKLYGWGMGTNCQLGLGDEEDRFEPTQIISKLLNSKKVIRVSSGGQHTVILGRIENNN